MTPVAPVHNPLVSVVMIAYNVEPYIAQAIDSVLSQDAPFTYELVIGEDCSTDRTRVIVEDYARRYPQVVRPLLRDQNLGMNRNFFATYGECRGRYVALLDADDYWTSPDKLATQVRFMEAHPECALSFHNAAVVYDDGSDSHLFHVPQPGPRLSTRMPPKTSGVRDLAGGNFIQTASVMYRAGLVADLPPWVLEMPTFDWPLHILHAEKGTVEYCDATMAAYRVHQGGMWSTGMSFYRTTREIDQMINAYHLISRHLGGRYRDRMEEPLAFLHERAMTVALRDGDYRTAGRHASRVLPSALRQGHLRRAHGAVGVLLKTWYHTVTDAVRAGRRGQR